MRLPLVFIFLAFLSIPFTAHAAVVINEIAWMGTSVSANDEWIELYNSGSESIDISGWTLSGGSLSISLTGSIGSNSYFLLERTDDTTVPSQTADQIFTGAISNTGTSLQLKDSGGTTIDTVDGSGNWAIGGDNTTKDTLQRNGSGWVTAPATPKAPNATVSSNPPPQNSGGTTGNVSSGSGSTTGSGNTTSTQTAAEKRITANAGADKTVVVGADTVFEGSASGFDGGPIVNARYVWNFGDGAVGEGKRVLHRFALPGEYVVMLTVASGEYSGSDRLQVRAEQAKLSIPSADIEKIEIQNDGAVEIDLGRWYLSSASGTFSIPEGSILPAGKKLLLASAVTKLASIESLTLHYPNGEIALSKNTVGTIEEKSDAPIPSSKGSVATVAAATFSRVSTAPKSSSPAPEEPTPAGDASSGVTLAASAAALDEGSTSMQLLPWVLGVLAIAGCAGAGILLARRPLPEEDFEIVDGS